MIDQITEETRINLNHSIRVYLSPEGVKTARYGVQRIKRDDAGPYIETHIWAVMHLFGPTLATAPGFTTHVYTNAVLLPPHVQPFTRHDHRPAGDRPRHRSEIIEAAARTLEKQDWNSAEIAILREIAQQIDRVIF